MATDPLKLRILKGMTAALKGITTPTYKTNLADFDPGDGVTQARVFRGRAWFGDNDPLPMVSVLEGVSPADDVAEPPTDAKASEYSWPILIQGFVNDDRDNPTDPAYVLLADVRQCLAAEKARKTSAHDPDVFGLGLKSKLIIEHIGPGVVRPADDVSAKAYFWLTVLLRVVDKPETPYA